MDNLESGTYEVFEKDPVKYREYQNAIHHALLDRVDIENVDKIEVVCKIYFEVLTKIYIVFMKLISIFTKKKYHNFY